MKIIQYEGLLVSGPVRFFVDGRQVSELSRADLGEPESMISWRWIWPPSRTEVMRARNQRIVEELHRIAKEYQ